uniref:PNPLA domain-containing protein n=1 Tax=Percolomonas cosmopolitus TaxID=63605 RepID=A0A7S1PFH2_9EUKA
MHLTFILSLTFAFILAFATLSTNATQICRALALGGGGDRGAFEAGVLSALVALQDSEATRYEVVTGISAGSINAAAFSQFRIGDEKKAVEFLLDRWRKTTKDDIYKNWFPGGIVEGFSLKSGLFDTSPLLNYLKENIDPQKVLDSGRVLLVGATNLEKNRFEMWNGTFHDLPQAVRASSAVPGIFETVKIGDDVYVDGGMTYMTPVTSAIQRCIRLHETTDVKVLVDVILAVGDAHMPGSLSKYNSTPFVLLKSLFGIIQNIFVGDIQNARLAFPQAQFRVIMPSKWLPGWFLGFTHAEEMIQMGYADGKAALNQTKWKL